MITKIVAVDDEESIRRLVKLALESEGYECHIAAEGDEGLRIIRAVGPSIVLLDVMMGKRDGFEIADEIRADPNLKDITIIMLSARDRDLGTLDGRTKLPDVNEYLSKPFDLKELIGTVKKYSG